MDEMKLGRSLPVGGGRPRRAFRRDQVARAEQSLDLVDAGRATGPGTSSDAGGVDRGSRGRGPVGRRRVEGRRGRRRRGSGRFRGGPGARRPPIEGAVRGGDAPERRRGGDRRIGRACDKPAARGQRRQQPLGHPGSRIDGKVDQDVPAENEIHGARRQPGARAGVGHQVHPLERDRRSQAPRDREFSVRPGEVAGDDGVVDVAERPRRVDAAPRLGQRAFGNVRRQDRAPAGQPLLLEQDGQRIGFLAGRAAGAPDPGSGRPGAELAQEPTDEVELVRMAEEIGFADGDGGDQRVQLIRLAAWRPVGGERRRSGHVVRRIGGAAPARALVEGAS